jgi:hypothetical protein
MLNTSTNGRAIEVIACEVKAGDFGEIGLDGGESIEVAKVVLRNGARVYRGARRYRLRFKAE